LQFEAQRKEERPIGCYWKRCGRGTIVLLEVICMVNQVDFVKKQYTPSLIRGQQ